MKLLGPGKRNHLTDVAGMLVGNAEDGRVNTGVTVVTARQPFACGVAVLGGAPGTRETDLLSPSASVAKVDALVLAGGSVDGLDAASGVVAGLAAAGHGLAVGEARVPRVPIVPAAILFDLANGGDKAWDANPYADLGRVALEAASDNCNLGSHGAGMGALCADCKGGLGAASLLLGDDAGGEASGNAGGAEASGEDMVVAALVAANPFGSVLCPTSQRFWAGGCEIGDEFGGLGLPHKPNPLEVVTKADAGLATGRGENTVIGVVATNLALDKAELTRLALMAQSGVARAVRPAHTALDGDVLFAVATGQREWAGLDASEDRGLRRGGVLGLLGHAAALCVSRAMARGVYLASPSAGDKVATAREILASD